MEIISFVIALKKYLGVNLIKDAKYLYKENYKPVKKEIKDHRRWKDLQYSWIRRINIVKIAALTKTIYMLNAIPIKISMTFIAEIIKAAIKFICKKKRP
jgi:hypothetical protein